MPYLMINGAVSFISFTKSVFGAVEKMKVLRDEGTVQHGEVMIGSSTIMVADATSGYPPAPAQLFIYVDNADDTAKKALEQGARMVEEISDKDYGRSGGIKDPFGNTWWITAAG